MTMQGPGGSSPCARALRAALWSAVTLAPMAMAPVDAKTFTLSEATIEDMQDAMKAGALSSVELTVLYLNRIAAYDPRGIKLNSMPVRNPAALAEATAADRLRAEGKLLGPLHGVPFTVKDSYKVKGLTLAAGSPAFAAMIANEDAFTVHRILAGGGVLLGKTNMPPLAAGGMQRGVYGRAESPYNAGYLTAAFNSGSSNGSGTSTSASFAAFGMGEETVSSGRSPSSNNGLVAYTPSRGVISIRGNWPLYPIKDVVVPMARTVDDMFKILDVIVADDPVTRGDFWRDQHVVPLPKATAVRPARYEDLADPGALRGKRIGVPTMYIGKDPTGKPIPIRPSILALWDMAVADLEAQGATVVEIDFPLMHNYDMDRPGAQGFVSRGLIPLEWFPARRAGAAVGADLEYEKLNPYSWSNFVTDNADPQLSSWRDVNPALVFPNPPGSVDARRRGPYRDYDKSKATILAGVTPIERLPKFADALRGLEQIRKVDFEQWLNAKHLDLVAFPANDDIGAANADIDDAAYDHATSNGVGRSTTNAMLRQIGIPSVSVTMGLMADIGMPVNITFIGKAYSDNALLSYGYAYERATHHRRAPGRVAPLADETIHYDGSTARIPAWRPEHVPPVVTVDPTVQASAGGLTFTGSASDASGLATVRVYVNGRKIMESSNPNWRAMVSMVQLRQWSDPAEKSVDVTVLAKDRFGNAGAVAAVLPLPTPAS